MAEQILKGSCLCGNVTYTAVGTAVLAKEQVIGKALEATATGTAVLVDTAEYLRGLSATAISNISL